MESSVSMRSRRGAVSRVEEHLLNLLGDITPIVDGQSQADPQFRTNRLYTRLTADELFLYGVTSKVTSDCLVDRLVDWWETVKERFSHIKTLVLNLDNGPENHSRRTQFMQRLLEFVQCDHITIRLAYYPPYHSKYNPVERCWGILEQHWNGSLLDWVDAVIKSARTMTWKGKHPVVELVKTTYQTGVKLTREAMDVVETQLQRLPSLEKWFVDIRCPLPIVRDD